MFTVSGLTPTGTHFHSGGAATTGAVLYDLTSAVTNNAAFGYWKNTDATPFNSTHSLNMNHAFVYLNVHTGANAGGEIRGQVNGDYSCSAAPSGIKTNLVGEVSNLYPNPTNGILNINFNSNNMRTIEISDITGKVMSITKTEAMDHKMNISELTPGVYFVKISSLENSAVVYKIIKN
jgi:hypothetical protein